MQRYGIDISKWQGAFDISKAKLDYGVEFVIIKAGGGDAGLYRDGKFERNYTECEKLGMPKGCYFFSQAMNMVEAKKEIDYFLGLIKGKRFDYPIFWDYEGKMLSLSKRELTDIAKYQLSEVQKAGYWVGIYTSQSHFNDHFFDEELKGYSHWVANYSASGKPKLQYSETQMWQCSGGKSAVVNPIMLGQNVDQNYCYIDYPERIKAKGLNGYPKTVLQPNESSLSTEYKVQAYAFLVKSNATNALIKLNKAGYTGCVTKSGLNYLVLIGSYSTKESADKCGKEMVSKKLINSYIVKKTK